MDTVKLVCDKEWVAVAKYSKSFSESGKCVLSRDISTH